MKTEKSLHDICIAKIKRSTMKPYDFKWTNFYDSNSDFSYSDFQLDLTESELIICSTIVDNANYSILTTKRLVTKQDGKENIGYLDGAIDKSYGDFKGYKDKIITFGQVQLQNGKDIKYFIETGTASMVMIHGLRTLLKTKEMTSKNIENVTRIWNKKNEE